MNAFRFTLVLAIAVTRALYLPPVLLSGRFDPWRGLLLGLRMMFDVVRASIHTLGGFSAHADQNGLLDWFAAVSPSRPRLILVHGENRARKVFSDLIWSRHGLRPECPNLGDVIEI